MLIAESARALNIMRLLLIAVALVMVGLYATRRPPNSIDRSVAGSRSADMARTGSVHRVTPWEYMARSESVAFLNRNMGKLRYPGAVELEDPNHPVELLMTVTDRPATVADYYSKKCGLKLVKSSESGAIRYSVRMKVKGSGLKIVIAPASEGSIIKFSFPDLHPPTQP